MVSVNHSRKEGRNDVSSSLSLSLLPHECGWKEVEVEEEEEEEDELSWMPSQDDSECANNLMMLKYRSVTPELIPEMTTTMMMMTTNTTACSRQSNQSSNQSNSQLCWSMALSTPEDAFWLSDLQCYVRSHCCEFFAASELDVKSNSGTTTSNSNNSNSNSSNRGRKGGRRGPVTVGRVGIRCVFCREEERSKKASQATSFPSQISGIYGAVVMMQCRHFPHCPHMPLAVRDILGKLKRGGSSSVPLASGDRSGRQQYWAESACQLGLQDTTDGIRYSPPPTTTTTTTNKKRPTLSLAYTHAVALTNDLSNHHHNHPNHHPFTQRPPHHHHHHHSSASYTYFNSVEEYQTQQRRLRFTSSSCSDNDEENDAPDATTTTAATTISSGGEEERMRQLMIMEGTSLVVLEDKELVPEYLFVAMAQMMVCRLTEADRVGCYKSRPLGFVGMCCKHCGGQPGFGKFFPATVRSLAQTTTSQTMVKHIASKCRLCPPSIRQALLQSQQAARPRYGSRKVFFQRVWARLHNQPLPPIPPIPPTYYPSPTTTTTTTTSHLPPPPTTTKTTTTTTTTTTTKKQKPTLSNPTNPHNQLLL